MIIMCVYIFFILKLICVIRIESVRYNLVMNGEELYRDELAN